MIYPPALSPGDTIAIVSPATTIKPEYVAEAARRLEEAGFRVAIAPHALGPASGTYAASDTSRTADFLAALQDPEVKAILCARGGYGCVHLLPALPHEAVVSSPKWLIGFSDVSALHAFWQHCGVASIHASMAKHLTEYSLDETCNASLLSILTSPAGASFCIEAPAHPLNTFGEAEGLLRGGNLAVLDGLAGTPFDILKVAEGEDVILFIEDIAEPIYKVERMLTRLYLSGTLSRLRGLVVGRFTEYSPDANFSDMESMIRSRLCQWGLRSLPVGFGFPIGHISDNRPIVEGSRARLVVTETNSTLEFKLI